MTNGFLFRLQPTTIGAHYDADTIVRENRRREGAEEGDPVDLGLYFAVSGGWHFHISCKEPIIMFKCIILALDGSGYSMLALKYARELAKRFDSKIIMVHAYSRTSDLRDYEGYDRLVAQRKNAGQQILESARKQLADVSIDVEEDLLEGPAAQAILSVAEIRKADLIILGTRGMGSFKGLLVGSVSNKITHHASCPVLVVR